MNIPTAPPRKPSTCILHHSDEALPDTTKFICHTCGRSESTRMNDPTPLDIIFSSFIPAVLSCALPYAYVLGYYIALYCLRQIIADCHDRKIKEKDVPGDEVIEIVPRAVQHASLDPHLNCINRFGSHQVTNHDSRIDLKKQKATGCTTDIVRSILRPYQNSSILIRDQILPKHSCCENPRQAAKTRKLTELVQSWNDKTAQMVSTGDLIRILGAYNERYKFQEGDMVRVGESMCLQSQRNSEVRREKDDTVVERIELVETWDRLTIEMCDHFYVAIFSDTDD